MVDLVCNPARGTEGSPYFETGIYVRAKLGEKWINADISQLDASSLLAWLRSRGGHNPWAENTVGLLLGHEGLVEQD